MNGLVDTIIEIIYDHPRGYNDPESLPLYAVVNVPESALD